MPQVFISYSRKDLAFVRDLAADLQAAGLEVWWDLSGIKGGDEWERKITEAIKRSEYMIVVLTPEAVDSRWVRKEYLRAEQTGLKIIPLQYKTCETPLALQDLQPIDGLDGKNPNYLLDILEAIDVPSYQRVRAKPKRSILPIPSHLVIGGLQFVKIPAGKFIMGSKDNNQLAYDDERPQHTLELPEYWMAKYPLTNEQYVTFKGQGEQLEPDWEEKKNHPVVNVSWQDAMQYCQWFNITYAEDLKKHALTLHLPTEAQWEKAARGEYGNEWPWGNEFDEDRCNSAGGKNPKRNTTPVNAYPQGESPYGVADMAGNVWEWTHTLFKAYPYLADDSREGEKDSSNRVLRGGSFNRYRGLVRCASRHHNNPESRYSNVGFRVCVSPIS
jgi:formylglycine-generating enzyme required for sulfatase activity